MNMRTKILRFFGPKFEAERMEHRLMTQLVMAHAEDLKRDIKAINGHAAEHPAIAGWKLKKSSNP